MNSLSTQDIFLLIPIIYLVVILGVQFVLAIRVWLIFKPHKEHNHYYNKNPRVSILIPAYNESVTIIDSVESMLKQDYKNYDIIVINDGSKDDTLQLLKDNYDLEESKEHFDRLTERIAENTNFDATKFKNVYYDKNRDIIVIDSYNGGKSTALNAGILISNSDYTLNVDADTMIRKDAISNTVKKKEKDSDAISCMVGITNGNPFDEKLLDHPQIPSKWLVRRQWLEYLTSFVLWRVGETDWKSITVIPGAFGFIRREALIAIGGYKRNFLAEDGELTLNLLKNGYKIQFISEFMAWTEVPETVKSLQEQRLRWYRGTLQNNIKYKDMLFNPKYNKFFSFFSLPFTWFSDIIGGWVEVVCWIIMTYYACVNANVDWAMFLGIWFVVILIYSTTMVFMLGFVHNKLYPKDHVSRIYRMIPIVMVETFTYHFLNLYWLLRSHINEYMKKKHNWNKFSRKGFSKK